MLAFEIDRLVRGEHVPRVDKDAEVAQTTPERCHVKVILFCLCVRSCVTVLGKQTRMWHELLPRSKGHTADPIGADAHVACAPSTFERVTRPTPWAQTRRTHTAWKKYCVHMMLPTLQTRPAAALHQYTAALGVFPNARSSTQQNAA